MATAAGSTLEMRPSFFCLLERFEGGPRRAGRGAALRYYSYDGLPTRRLDPRRQQSSRCVNGAEWVPCACLFQLAESPAFTNFRLLSALPSILT